MSQNSIEQGGTSADGSSSVKPVAAAVDESCSSLLNVDVAVDDIEAVVAIGTSVGLEATVVVTAYS